MVQTAPNPNHAGTPAPLTTEAAPSALAGLLARYDATPRTEGKYRPAFDALRTAALAAGMPKYCNAVVTWSRQAIAEASQ